VFFQLYYLGCMRKVGKFLCHFRCFAVCNSNITTAPVNSIFLLTACLISRVIFRSVLAVRKNEINIVLKKLHFYWVIYLKPDYSFKV